MPQRILFIYPQQWFPNTLRGLHGINLEACCFRRFSPSPSQFSTPLKVLLRKILEVKSQSRGTSSLLLLFIIMPFGHAQDNFPELSSKVLLAE